jgi:hypothetical protein
MAYLSQLRKNAGEALQTMLAYLKVRQSAYWDALTADASADASLNNSLAYVQKIDVCSDLDFNQVFICRV